MKGSLHTDELLAEVVRKDTGLRTARRISHVYVMDVPTYPKALFITDAAVNIFPTLEDKVDILQNAIELAQVLRIKQPKVAILSGSRDGDVLDPLDDRRRSLVQDRRARIDHRRPPRRPARLRQCDQSRGGGHQAHQIRGLRRRGHPSRARPRGRQHASQGTEFPRQRRCGRDRAGSACPDYSDEPRRQCPRAHGELRRRRALRPFPTGGCSRQACGVIAIREPILARPSSTSCFV